MDEPIDQESFMYLLTGEIANTVKQDTSLPVDHDDAKAWLREHIKSRFCINGDFDSLSLKNKIEICSSYPVMTSLFHVPDNQLVNYFIMFNKERELDYYVPTMTMEQVRHWLAMLADGATQNTNALTYQITKLQSALSPENANELRRVFLSFPPNPKKEHRTLRNYFNVFKKDSPCDDAVAEILKEHIKQNKIPITMIKNGLYDYMDSEIPNIEDMFIESLKCRYTQRNIQTLPDIATKSLRFNRLLKRLKIEMGKTPD